MPKKRHSRSRGSKQKQLLAEIPKALSIPGLISNTFRNMKLRWKVLNTGPFDVIGTDVAHWCNIVTIPGAFNAAPLFAAYLIKRVTVYCDSPTGSATFAWPAPAALGGFMLPDPTIKLAATSLSAYSSFTARPPKGSIASQWIQPPNVNTTGVFSIDMTGTGYIEVVFDAAFRYGPPYDGLPGPGPVYIYGTATPASVGVTGTFVCGPLCLASAALLAPAIGIMVY